MKRLWHRVVRLWQRLSRPVKVAVLVAGLMVTVAVTTFVLTCVSCHQSRWYRYRCYRCFLARLIVRNFDPELVAQLKLRAAEHGRSVEAEHRGNSAPGACSGAAAIPTRSSRRKSVR
jgi:hypothetical protein